MFCLEGEGGGGRWPKQCIHVNKCKNDKIINKNKKVISGRLWK
jgi:hypothetical protein